MSESYIEVELSQQPIELYKLLKIADLVSGGGEAKVVISEGYVLLNGEVEHRKRKKIYHEDIVEFNGEVIQLIINDSEVVAEAVNTSNSTKKDVTEHKDAEESPVISEPVLPKKRRPIAFK